MATAEKASAKEPRGRITSDASPHFMDGAPTLLSCTLRTHTTQFNLIRVIEASIDMDELAGLKIDKPEPLSFQAEMVRYLKSEEPGLWKWFASTGTRVKQTDGMRLNLLKTTYRIEAALQPCGKDAAHRVNHLRNRRSKPQRR